MWSNTREGNGRAEAFLTAADLFAGVSSFSLARRALHPSLPETLADAALAEEDQS